MCSKLFSLGCHTVSSVFPFCPTSEFSSLAPCSISHHFQTLHYCLSNSFFCWTIISISHDFSSTQSQIASFIWFSLVVFSQGYNSYWDSYFFSCCPYSLESTPEHVTSSNGIVSFRHHLKTHLFRLGLSFLSFNLIWWFVDELCIIPGLLVFPTPVVGALLISILFEDIGAI